MNKTTIKAIFAACVLAASLVSCDKDTETLYVDIWKGNYTSEYVASQNGFPDYRDSLLNALKIDGKDFIRISTDSAWALSTAEQDALMKVRKGVKSPGRNTLLSKIIPLSDLHIYMDNVFGGTVGGFVAVAADVKELHTMSDVFNGMRLDYPGTSFSATGAGYAVIRFHTSHADKLSIPLCPELGGSVSHSWPNTGGGFTASTVGRGGLPEYQFAGYYAPEEGAEIYEITPLGHEILRSQFRGGRWTTYDPSADAKIQSRFAGNAVEGKTIIYNGHEYMLRGINNGVMTLATYDNLKGHKQIERGVWAIEVPAADIN